MRLLTNDRQVSDPCTRTFWKHRARDAARIGLGCLALIVCLLHMPATAESRPLRLPMPDATSTLCDADQVARASHRWAGPYAVGGEFFAAASPDDAFPGTEPFFHGEPSLVLPPPPDYAEPATSPWSAAYVRRDDVRDSCPPGGYAVVVSEPWTLQVMPQGLLYRSYLAGVKEPRLTSVWSSDSRVGGLWDAALGGRLGVLRYGTQDPVTPEGWQVDLEGGSQTRLDPGGPSTPLLSVDFRVGIPVTYARGPWQFKTGYYHISSHLGDEFLLMNPSARRLNYVRDAVMLGVGYFCIEQLRVYGEIAYAVGVSDGAEPLECQYGLDWAPARDTGLRGAPFFAANAHLREELDFGGNIVLQTGWAWRRQARGSLFRVGVQYYKGKSEQYEYYDHHEERFGGGLWVDF